MWPGPDRACRLFPSKSRPQGTRAVGGGGVRHVREIRVSGPFFTRTGKETEENLGRVGPHADRAGRAAWSPHGPAVYFAWSCRGPRLHRWRARLVSATPAARPALALILAAAPSQQREASVVIVAVFMSIMKRSEAVSQAAKFTGREATRAPSGRPPRIELLCGA